MYKFNTILKLNTKKDGDTTEVKKNKRNETWVSGGTNLQYLTAKERQKLGGRKIKKMTTKQFNRGLPNLYSERQARWSCPSSRTIVLLHFGHSSSFGHAKSSPCRN